MVSRATSYRLDPDVKSRLERQAAAEGITERALLERLASEGLDTLHHPGVVYRDGPTGRRAALAVGPDIWEVVSALRFTKALQRNGWRPWRSNSICILGIFVSRSISRQPIAPEIDVQVTANDAAAEQARQLAEQRARLMAP